MELGYLDVAPEFWFVIRVIGAQVSEAGFRFQIFSVRF